MVGVWTRNYYNMLTAACLGDEPNNGGDFPGTPTDYSSPLRARQPGGAYYNLKGYYDPSYLTDAQGVNIKSMLLMGKTQCVLVTDQYFGLQGRYFGVGFGSNNTPATFDDYTLAFVSAGLTLSSTDGALTVPSTVYDTNRYKSERQYTVTNGSANTYTINEFGIFLPLNSTYNNSNGCALVYREVFDAPISFAPGESFLLNFLRDGEIFGYQPY